MCVGEGKEMGKIDVNPVKSYNNWSFEPSRNNLGQSYVGCKKGPFYSHFLDWRQNNRFLYQENHIYYPNIILEFHQKT